MLYRTWNDVIALQTEASIELSEVLAQMLLEKDSNLSKYTLQSLLEPLQEAIIKKVMEGTGGNVSLTARLLGVSRGTLISRLKRMSNE